MKYKIIVGLPGSGKSHLLNELSKEGWRTLDDPCLNKNFKEELKPQSDNDMLAIADPHFCKEYSLKHFLTFLEPNSEIDFIYFENNPDAALATRSQDERSTINFVKKLSKGYVPIAPRPIWRKP